VLFFQQGSHFVGQVEEIVLRVNFRKKVQNFGSTVVGGH
jgi:hypothetical protein